VLFGKIIYVRSEGRVGNIGRMYCVAKMRVFRRVGNRVWRGTCSFITSIRSSVCLHGITLLLLKGF